MFQMGVREIRKGIIANTKEHTHTPRFPPTKNNSGRCFSSGVRACSGTLIRNRQFFLFFLPSFLCFLICSLPLAPQIICQEMNYFSKFRVKRRVAYSLNLDFTNYFTPSSLWQTRSCSHAAEKQHLPPLHLIISPCANPLPVGGKREREKRKNLGMEKYPDLPSR